MWNNAQSQGIGSLFISLHPHVYTSPPALCHEHCFMPKEWWWSWSRYQKILLLKCPIWLHLYAQTTERQCPGLGNAAQLSAADADTLSIMHLFHAYSDPQHWLRAVWWEWTFSVGRLAQAAPCPHRTQAVPCCLRAGQYSQGSWPQNSNRPAIPGQAGLLPSARVSTRSSLLSQLQNKETKRLICPLT